MAWPEAISCLGFRISHPKLHSHDLDGWGAGDFVTPHNRFPFHYQLVTGFSAALGTNNRVIVQMSFFPGMRAFAMCILISLWMDWLPIAGPSWG
jgi:hypothetical protein